MSSTEERRLRAGNSSVSNKTAQGTEKVHPLDIEWDLLQYDLTRPLPLSAVVGAAAAKQKQLELFDLLDESDLAANREALAKKGQEHVDSAIASADIGRLHSRTGLDLFELCWFERIRAISEGGRQDYD